MKYHLIALILLVAVALPPVRADQGKLKHVGRPVKDSYIAVFDSTQVHDGATVAAELANRHAVRVAATYRWALNGFAFTGTEQQAAAMSNDPRIKWVQEDNEFTLTIIQNPAPSWGLDRIDQQAQSVLTGNGIYAAGYTGVGTAVYILDSGINPIQSEFGSRIRLQKNFGPDRFGVTDPNYFGDCVVNNTTPTSYGHGTRVASAAAGATYGVAKDAAIVNIRVSDCFGRVNLRTLAQGVDFMVQDHQSHPTEAAVANISVSGSPDDTLDSSIMNALNSGITVVVGAGNDNSDACNYSPSRLGRPTSFVPNPMGLSTITVGGTTRTDARSSYSNYGPCVDIFAPADYYMLMGANGVADDLLQGTSFSSPLVAGVASIHMQRYSIANSPNTVEGMIKDNSTPNVLSSIPAGTPNLILWNGILSKYHACCIYP